MNIGEERKQPDLYYLPTTLKIHIVLFLDFKTELTRLSIYGQLPKCFTCITSPWDRCLSSF